MNGFAHTFIPLTSLLQGNHQPFFLLKQQCLNALKSLFCLKSTGIDMVLSRLVHLFGHISLQTRVIPINM